MEYSRGHIEITNLDGLEEVAFECYAAVSFQYRRLLNEH